MFFVLIIIITIISVKQTNFDKKPTYIFWTIVSELSLMFLSEILLNQMNVLYQKMGMEAPWNTAEEQTIEESGNSESDIVDNEIYFDDDTVCLIDENSFVNDVSILNDSQKRWQSFAVWYADFYNTFISEPLQFMKEISEEFLNEPFVLPVSQVIEQHMYLVGISLLYMEALFVLIKYKKICFPEEILYLTVITIKDYRIAAESAKKVFVRRLMLLALVEIMPFCIVTSMLKIMPINWTLPLWTNYVTMILTTVLFQGAVFILGESNLLKTQKIEKSKVLYAKVALLIPLSVLGIIWMGLYCKSYI